MKTNTHFNRILSFILKMKNISDKNCVENQNKQFILIFFFDNHAVYETKYKNIAEPGMLQMTI